MERYLGGFILIPKQIVSRSVDVFEQALSTFKSARVKDILAYLDERRQELDPNDLPGAFAAMREAGCGEVILKFYGLSAYLQAQESLEGYAVFALHCEDTPFIEFLNAAQHNEFVSNWTQFCQQVHAYFGYFSRFDYVAEEEYRDEIFLSALKSQDFEQLGHQFIECWLQYYSPQLLQNNASRQVLAQSFVEARQDFDYKAATLTNLDNGGLLFRSGAHPMDDGDGNAYE